MPHPSPYAPPQTNISDENRVAALRHRTRNRSNITIIILVVSVAVWCVVLPFVWPYNVGRIAGIGYWQMLSYYIPELVVGAIVLVCLPLVFLRQRLAVVGLVLAAVLGPIIKITIGTPGDMWLLSPVLLSVLSWQLHVRKPRVA